MSSNWTEKAIEPFFNLLEKEVYDDDKINMDKVYCSESSLIKGQRGVFALESIKKGEIIEWGIATIIPGLNVCESDIFFTWNTKDRHIGATASGCALFYNTLGDKSNARCVPYHNENRFEIYALEDIHRGDEITFRYDSMNYREGMKEVLNIVGELKDGDKL
tara:strand:- start:247 stop:732 length:486 start_codon:yes stop_codon:yes gene_type:complete